MKKSLLAAAVLLAAGPVLGDNLLQVYEKAVVNDARIARRAPFETRRRSSSPSRVPAAAEPVGRRTANVNASTASPSTFRTPTRAPQPE